jgi:hypothetical protein
MRRIAIGIAALCLSGGAHAQSVSYTFSGSGTSSYAVITSAFTIQGFDSSLGSLTKAVLDTSGTIDVTVQPTGAYAPLAQYNFSSSEGIYQSNGPATYGGNGLSGTGSVAYTNPNGNPPDFTYVFTLSGSGQTTYTGGQLAQFIGQDIDAYFHFDAPGGFLSANGNSISYDLVSSTAKGSGKITYFYEPLTRTVPEPATWAMMMLGFGAVGTVLRRRPMGQASVRAA